MGEVPLCMSRIWHIEDNQGQVRALTFGQKFLKPFKVFPLR